MNMAPFTKARWLGLFSVVAVTCGAVAQAAAMIETPGQGTPFADGTVEAGMLKAATCTACHGPNGNSTNPLWPKLAGQNAVYIAEQLRLFKAGVRVNPVMLGMSSTLSDKDIDSVAVYFEAQTTAGSEADAALWKAGESLYRFGDPARDIPACTACHGPVGRGNDLAGYPSVRAQYAEYVTNQLHSFASGARYAAARAGAPTSRNGSMMETIAKRLTDDDIKHVAADIQGMR